MAGKSKKDDNNVYGITGLTLSILGLLMPFFGLVLGIMGIVFSQMQKNRSPNPIATAGFIVGTIATAVQLIMIIILVMAIIYLIPYAVVSTPQ